MEIAKIRVNDVYAGLVFCKDIPAGIIGATVSIEYDDAMWDGLRKTVVFKGAETRVVADAGSVVTVPAEAVASKGVRLRVGIYGTDAENNVAIPTLWANLGIVCDATDPSGDPATDPTLPVWQQILNIIGDAEDLNTEDKSSLVAAINEVLRKGGGEIDAEQLKQLVAACLAENPPEESDPTVHDWAKQPEKPTYTAEEVGALPSNTEIPAVPTDISAFTNDAGYLTEHQDLSGYAKTEDIPSDDHIKDLIDNALGVIENGTY